jgi:hypothetical protein
LDNRTAVASSLVLEQSAMSPAPTNVTVVVCPTLGAALSAAVVPASSTAKTIEVKTTTILLILYHPALVLYY